MGLTQLVPQRHPGWTICARKQPRGGNTPGLAVREDYGSTFNRGRRTTPALLETRVLVAGWRGVGRVYEQRWRRGASPSGGQSPDPVVLDFPIAYVKRPVPADTAMAPDARELLPFQPGADLYLRDRASPTSAERNLTAEITKGMGDVRDVEPSYDGRKLVFALREPNIVGAAPEDQPTWNIWEYDLDLQQLRRVIASDTTAEDGQDVAPHYLPDGRIVFSSTRQRQSKAILLDEGKPQFEAQDENNDEPAFVLHVMNADGFGSAPGFVQPEPRPGSSRVARWTRRLQPLGPRSRARRDQPVHDAARRQRPPAAVRCRAVTTPAPMARKSISSIRGRRPAASCWSWPNPSRRRTSAASCSRWTRPITSNSRSPRCRIVACSPGQRRSPPRATTCGPSTARRQAGGTTRRFPCWTVPAGCC